jgi:hypothetical protein
MFSRKAVYADVIGVTITLCSEGDADRRVGHLQHRSTQFDVVQRSEEALTGDFER